MLRKPVPYSTALRILASGSLLALLAACAGGPETGSPDVPVAQETANYRAHARSYYAPPGPPEDPWGPYIDEASRRFDVPDTWIRAVIGRESGGQQFRGGTLTTSPVGAMGLMQLMAPTYDELRAQYALGDDPYEPHDNIMAGTAYVRQMYDIYGSPGFLAAYNTGPGRLDDFLTRNRALPRETRQYVAIIGPQIAGIYPNNRSQADLLVAAHEGEDTTQVAQNNVQARSVRAAWSHRGGDNADQPIQVAEAPAPSSPSPAPAYTQTWTSVPAAAAVSAAWAHRNVGEQNVGDRSVGSGSTQLASAVPPAPVPAAAPDSVAAAWAARRNDLPPPGRLASAAPVPASPNAVAAAWAARDGSTAAPSPAPATFTTAAAAPAPTAPPGGRIWTPAPTDDQKGDQMGVVPADPAQPIRVADAVPPSSPVRAVVPAAPAVPAAPRRQRFALIRTAVAEPAPLGRDGGRAGSRDWSVQVGAFNSSAQASQAAGAAQQHAPSLLRARAEIAPVRTGRARMFRARLTGLSRVDAMQACERLAHGRADCMVVSPDARS